MAVLPRDAGRVGVGGRLPRGPILTPVYRAVGAQGAHTSTLDPQGRRQTRVSGRKATRANRRGPSCTIGSGPAPSRWSDAARPHDFQGTTVSSSTNPSPSRRTVHRWRTRRSDVASECPTDGLALPYPWVTQKEYRPQEATAMQHTAATPTHYGEVRHRRHRFGAGGRTALAPAGRPRLVRTDRTRAPRQRLRQLRLHPPPSGCWRAPTSPMPPATAPATASTPTGSTST